VWSFSRFSQGLTLEPTEAVLISIPRRHMDKHDRPYTCAETTCPSHQEGFTTKGDLKRHTQSVHEDSTFYCPQQRCIRFTNKPFARKDHLADHIKRVHNGIIAQASAGAPDGSTSLAVAQSSPEVDRNEVKRSVQQPRTVVRTTRKRRRLNSTPPPESVDTAPCGHEDELEELRRKVAKLERRLQLSKAGEEKLAELVNHYREQIE
jgi:hypothetical protein